MTFELIRTRTLEEMAKQLTDLEDKKGYTVVWETYRLHQYTDHLKLPQTEHSVLVHHSNPAQINVNGVQYDGNNHKIGFGRKDGV